MRTTVRTNSAGRRGHGPVFLGENAERKQSEIGKLNSNEGAGGLPSKVWLRTIELGKLDFILIKLIIFAETFFRSIFFFVYTANEKCR